MSLMGVNLVKIGSFLWKWSKLGHLDHDFRDKNVPIIPEKMVLVDFERLEYTFKCIFYGFRWVVSLLQAITLTYDGSISKNDVFLWYLGHNPWFCGQIWPYKSRKNFFHILKMIFMDSVMCLVCSYGCQ